MGTTAVDPHFIDANVLLYARNTGSPFHAAAVAALDGLIRSRCVMWVSRQIVREYMAGASRPGVIVPPLTRAEILADVAGFLARFRVAEDGAPVTTELLALLGTVAFAGKQVHDANIVATMLAWSLPALVTNNVADFNRYSHLIRVVPILPPVGPSPPGVP